MARCKVLKIGSGFLPMIFSGGKHRYDVVGDPIPSLAKVVGAVMSEGFDEVRLLVQSDEFPDVPDDQPYPDLVPTITSVA